MAELDRNKIELIEMYRDNPAAAARDLLGIDLAPHQRVILKSMWDCDNVIAVLSRGSGKCITGDSIVLTKSGFEYIDDVCNGGKHTKGFSYNRTRIEAVYGENGYHRPGYTFINEKHRVVKIKTKFGYTISGVLKHNIRCLEDNVVKWKELGKIKIGDVAIISKDMDYNFYEAKHCILTNFDIGYKHGYKVKYRKQGRVGFHVMHSCREGLRGFLCGYFDRYSYWYDGECTLVCCSLEMARFIHIALLTYGIVSKLKNEEVTICKDYFHQFNEQISSRIEEKLVYYDMVLKGVEKVDHPKYLADEIVGIEIEDDVVTYDFSFYEDYTFISNGFISHNTFIDGVFATLRALLYPGERVGLFSSSFRQCLTLDVNNIFTNIGMVKTKDIFNSDITHIQSDRSYNKILNKWKNEISCGYEIKTNGMFEFSAKNGHRVLVSNENGIEYKNIEDILVGDILPVRIGFNYFGNTIDLPVDNYKVTGYDNPIKIPEKMTKDFAYFLGLICGDGCITKNNDGNGYRICFVTADKELEDKYISIMNNVFGVENISIGRKKKDDGSYSNCNYYNVNSKHLYSYLEQCGLSNCGATNKLIPEVIKKAPKEFVCEFLKGLFDTDGFVSYSCKRSNSLIIGLSTSSKQMAEEVRDILLNLGIFAKITVSLKEGEKEVIKGKVSKVANNYRVYISSSKYVDKYMNEISFLLKRKREIFENANNNKPRWEDRLIYPKEIMTSLKNNIIKLCGKKRGSGYFLKSIGQIQSKYITPDRINRFIDEVVKYDNRISEFKEYKKLKQMYCNQYAFVEVIEKNKKEVETFDIEVENEHCYWAGGFIHHNSKFIFDEVAKLYDISSILRESCEKKPTKMVDQCYLQFKGYNNKPGSIIQCLPLGTGDKIRGARFFTVICDEAAQIPKEVLDIVIRGMMATSKNPMEQVRALQEQKRLLAEGKIDKIKKMHQNKLVLTSTAYYQYNHLWQRVSLFIRLLMEKIDKAKVLSKKGIEIPEDLLVELRGHDINNQIPYNVMKDNNRALITCTYEDMPEGFMNTESIEEARLQMPRYQFLMEYCFSSGTPVFTNYGFKNIENVNIGDLVLTHNGRFMPVTNKYERKYTGKMFDIIPFGYSSGYSVTDGHRFYTKYGFKSIAQLLRMKKTFMVPLKILNGNNNIDMTKYCNSYLLSCVNNEDYIYPITGKSSLKNGDRGTDKIFKSSIRRFINLDYHLGIVIGYYVSEGSIGSHGKQINFSLDGHIDKTLCHFIKELCDSIYYSFGIKPHKHIINNVCIVNINSVILCEFFKKICPGVSDTKIVDPDILFSNEMFMKGYLTGYWHGDGCINRKPQAVAGCVNKELLSQIMLVLSYFGFPSSIRKSSDSCIKKINGVDRNIKECWSLTMKGNTSLLFDNFINNKNNVLNNNVFKNEMIKNDEGLFYFKIKKHSERFVEDEIVYNLSVKEDESYCIPTATCHNCSLFPADSDGFFPMSVLDKARSHGEFSCCESLKKEEGFVNVMACDPARTGDNFAIAILRANKNTGKIRLVRVFTYNKKPFPFMHLEIRKLINQFAINELVIDSGGGGRTIRDLLADKQACPPGDDVILQIDFDEHRYLKGRKMLRLVEFSDYEWLSNANNNMLLGLQNGTFQIACEKGKLKNISNSDCDETAIEEEMRKEIDRTIEEIQNIVVSRTNVGRMHWDTPHKNQRKDRYSAVLIGYDAAYYYIENLTKPQKLVSGFWI